MTTTTKAIKGTVVSPTTVVMVKSDEEMANILMAQKGSTMAEVAAITEPKMRKTGNPYIGHVIKVSTINIGLGGDYEKAVARQMEKEGKKGEFQAKPNWHIGWKGSAIIRINRKDDPENPQKMYAMVRCLRSDKVEYRWNDGQFMNNAEIAHMKTFIPERKEAPGQPVENKIVVRTITIGNIHELRMNKIVYRRQR